MEFSDDTDAAGLQAYADELRAAFMRLQSQAPELNATARAVQVTETSPDGMVTVTVSSRGELLSLDIDPRVYRNPDARTLADTITETVHRATATARERIVEVFAPLIPADQLRAHLDGDLDAVITQLAEQMDGKG